MIEVLHAIRAALDQQPSTVVTHIGDATGQRPPFRVAWGPPTGRDADEQVAATSATSARIGLTCTASTAEVALAMARDAIAALTPNLRATILPGVPGRHVTLAFDEARDVQIDRTTTYPDTGHPAYVVILFTAYSQEA